MNEKQFQKDVKALACILKDKLKGLDEYKGAHRYIFDFTLYFRFEFHFKCWDTVDSFGEVPLNIARMLVEQIYMKEANQVKLTRVEVQKDYKKVHERCPDIFIYDKFCGG